jgi:hypothetical protein
MGTPPSLTRRQLLLGGAGTLVLAACGSNGSTGNAGATSSSTTAAGGLVLFKAFQGQQPVGAELRLPLALADKDGSFDVELPRTIVARLRRPDGTITPPTSIDLHDKDLPRGYFPLRTTFDTAGRWTVLVEAGKVKVATTVDAVPKSAVPSIPAPGDPLPVVPTPTTANHQGVNPICTRNPVCPFHAVSLDEAIGGSKPIALLVSTPAYCQVAICGPVLDLFVARKAALAGIEVIHAEVYIDSKAQQTAPIVDALGLDYEPSLFLAAPDGTVTDRLDSIFDGAELDEALARLAP